MMVVLWQYIKWSLQVAVLTFFGAGRQERGRGIRERQVSFSSVWISLLALAPQGELN